METVVGSIILVGFNFEPPGFLFCDGRILSVQQYMALFSLIGNKFGGDGMNNFALPKLPAPQEGLQYLIAFNGTFPSRS
ncbi:MAG: tail fiber protein [Bacteroidetes bacterium]|nr:tail fiber protein [Bacteroidota bacterium]